MPVHLEEFLYRGRAEDSTEPLAWHVVLLSITKDEFGENLLRAKTLNITQAEEAGWPLPEVIATINTEAMKEVEALRTELAALKEQLRSMPSPEPAPETETLKRPSFAESFAKAVATTPQTMAAAWPETSPE
jgi:hypothetical protein